MDSVDFNMAVHAVRPTGEAISERFAAIGRGHFGSKGHFLVHGAELVVSGFPSANGARADRGAAIAVTRSKFGKSAAQRLIIKLPITSWDTLALLFRDFPWDPARGRNVCPVEEIAATCE